MASPLSLAVGPRFLYGELFTTNKLLNVCPFDYTAFAVNGKVRIPYTGLTTQDGLLSLLNPTALSRSTIVEKLTFLMALL